ncbi:EKC/KEOPS complex subunit Gon7p [[Candida] anglica]|uniref:EKC/KEOPS complex subunit GON7 n=1 Tax=[Candida] anglica TaxID=148631 RepID=A0ABP0EIV0_9ASCO
MSLDPIAIYSSPSGEKEFTSGEGPHTTNGKTTQISDIVIQAGGEDRDKPSEAKDTNLGQLRAKLTTVQDQVNQFLTQQMNRVKDAKTEADDIERRILDDGIDEDSD